MNPIYPSLESPEFDRDFEAVVTDIGELSDLFERKGIQQRTTVTIDDKVARAFDDVTGRYNGLLERTLTLGAYIRSFVTTNSRDDLAQARMSELQQHLVRLDQLGTRFTAWVGSLDLDALLERSSMAHEHAFPLRKAAISAQHLMSPPEEDLAAELGPSGGGAWSKLHGDLTSQITVPIEIDGETQDAPMSVIRNLAYDQSREVRRRAYEAEISAWKQVAVPLAAALNSIKGEVNTISRHRGWDSPLDAALFGNNIDRQTLDAMLGAARESFPDFRRYLHIKARALGLERLAWYDLFAPVGRTSTEWNYQQGTAFMLERFGAYSERLRDFAARAITENWIDAEPRPGKVGGAFCMQVRPGVSRVLSNYLPSYDGVSTLAHELGHAYHNLNLAGRTVFQRQTPMALAETASIFCETIIEHAALARADREEQIAILESSLQGRCQVVVDITSRFSFESGVFERRLTRELSIDELCTLMVDTQRDTYGEGLDESVLHPYMWAVKGHYYSHHRSFYNYPYMFGLLFGLGLYAQYEKDPDGFKSGYDRLLSRTGLADAAALASEFGIDLRTPPFWRSSLDIIRRDVDRFDALIG
jgi:pepF/M3 family oligoendopeptidase